MRREPGRLRVRLASHAAAEAAAAAGVAGAVAVFPFWNDRDYENSGWTCFESGVSGEAIAQAQHFNRSGRRAQAAAAKDHRD